MQLRLTTQSFVLMGAGEGTAMIDADSVFHPTGFPYIPGRRIKGLLRESLLEAMEMFGEEQTTIDATVAKLFGYEGSDGPKGGLVFPSLYLDNWKPLQAALAQLSPDDRQKIFFPESIKRQYSTEIPQTAVVDGVAKDSSLRMYRVLNPSLHFEAPFKAAMDEASLTWLRRAVANLRRAGTRRNKGFGTIKLQLVDAAITTEKQAEKAFPLPNSNRLCVTIKTLSPVLLSQRDGEQNTVFTERHVAGTHLRGLIAEQVIRHKGLNALAHLDDQFARWILNGALSFGDCSLRGGTPFPLNVQQAKGQQDAKAHDVFLPLEGKSKPIDGVGSIQSDTIHRARPKTTFMFHNSRPNRTAGKSMDTDDSQGIFYYEALAEGQEFVGEIVGANATDIAELLALTGTNFSCQMGRSRSAQYGAVEVRLEPQNYSMEMPESSPSHHYYLMVASPLILLNAMGEAEADASLLAKALRAKGLHRIEILNAHTQSKWVEQYNATWQSKTARVQAFSTGSVFELASTAEDWPILSQLRQLGEQGALGFGRLLLFPKEAFSTPLAVVDKLREASTSANVSEPEVLVAIRRLHQQQELRTKAKNKAIDDAKAKRLDVPNHLASWLLSKLATRRLKPEGWRNEWNNWLTDLKAKNQKAFKTMDEFRLFDPLLALQPLGSRDTQYDEDWGHQYWTTFLETLRKRNKEENR